MFFKKKLTPPIPSEDRYIYIARFVNNNGCFDLQFRRDIRHERLKKPTYYRWKVQFVIVLSEDKIKSLEKTKNTLNCGKIHFTKNRIRYSVQDVDSLYNIIIPFFKKYQLSGNKKEDFNLWAEALEIIYRNKGKNLAIWSRKDFQRLIEIQKAIQKYKIRRHQSFKWLSTADSIAKILEY